MNVVFNGELRRVAENATVSDVLRQLELNPRYVAVEVNEQLVPRGEHDRRALGEGDRLEVVTLVGGG